MPTIRPYIDQNLISNTGKSAEQSFLIFFPYYRDVPPLSTWSTQYLLEARPYGGYSPLYDCGYTAEDLYAELAKRPHISNKAERRDIRKKNGWNTGKRGDGWIDRRSGKHS